MNKWDKREPNESNENNCVKKKKKNCYQMERTKTKNKKESRAAEKKQSEILIFKIFSTY